MDGRVGGLADGRAEYMKMDGEEMGSLVGGGPPRASAGGINPLFKKIVC